MREKLSARISRIISGTANSIVDAIEGSAPETVMEQAIRDVDGVIDEVREDLGRVEANKHLLTKSATELSAKHDALEEQIQTALAEDREDLAEAAVAKQIDIEAQLPVIEANLQDAREEEERHNQAIAALQAKKREMQEEHRRYRQAQKSAGVATAEGKARSDPMHKAEKAGAAFARVHERTTGFSGPDSALDSQNAAKIAELQELHRKNQIRERLEKAKLLRRGE